VIGADTALAAARAAQDAKALVQQVRAGEAPPDAIYAGLQRFRAGEDLGATSRELAIRAFLRAIQKALEGTR
jgi:hypothetical protein